MELLLIVNVLDWQTDNDDPKVKSKQKAFASKKIYSKRLKYVN